MLLAASASAILTRPKRGNAWTRVNGFQYTGSSAHQTCDFYEPDALHAGAPIVVVLHAGGWDDSVDYTINGAVEVSEQLASAGFCVVRANYRGFGSPGFNRTVPAADIAALMTYLRANGAAHGGDPTRIYILGQSAGGQIGGMLAVTGTPGGTRPDLIITWSAPLDIELCVGTFAEANAESFIGAPWIGNNATWRSQAPGRVATGATVPWLCVFSANEPTGPGQAGVVRGQSLNLVSQMAAFGQTVETFEFTLAAGFSNDTIHYRFTRKQVNDIWHTAKSIDWFIQKGGPLLAA